MDEPRWADDIPPPYGQCYGMGQRCLDQINAAAREFPQRSALEHELLDLLRTQAQAIGELAAQVIALHHLIPVPEDWDRSKELEAMVGPPPVSPDSHGTSG